jgi:predicted dehydrogenase
MVSLGIIGVGVLGEYHLQKCLSAEDVEVTGIFDADPERAASVGRRYDVAAFSSSNALIDRVDACIIATPCTTHATLVQQCIEHDTHVLVEKPLAESYGQGEAIVRNARKKGLVLHIGHSEAFNPAYIALRNHAPRPQFIEIHRLAPYNVRGTDVSVVLDLMVHDIHLVYQLCGAQPCYDTIAATGVPVVSRTHDIANARLAFPNGCIANITASRISVKKMRKLRLFQKNAYFSVDLDTKTCEYYVLNRNVSSAFPVEKHEQQLEANDPLSEELHSFIFEITHAKQVPATRGDEALTTLRITDAVLSEIVHNNR